MPANTLRAQANRFLHLALEAARQGPFDGCPSVHREGGWAFRRRGEPRRTA